MRKVLLHQPSNNAKGNLNKLTEEQRKKIKEMDDLLLSVHNRMQAMQDKVPDASVSTALEKRIKELEAQQQDASEIPPEVVSAGEFPGSMKIPGSNLAFKIGGRVNFSMVYNLQALGVDDRFLTAAIPIRGSEAAGEGARLTIQIHFHNAEGDLDLELFDPRSRRLARSDSKSDQERVSAGSLASGLYLARVYGYGGTRADYSLAVDVH